jgi:hypothetical protein
LIHEYICKRFSGVYCSVSNSFYWHLKDAAANNFGVMSSFERVRELCPKVIACETEAETIERARQVARLDDEHIEKLRGNVTTTLAQKSAT